MRQLYLFFEEQKWSLNGTKLSLSHIRELFSLKDSHAINYYISISSEQNLTRDELRNRTKSNWAKKRTYRSNTNIYELYR